ncbi:hypothetical protein CLG96_00145 [Sphingomonas oleivorans]|uniref:Phage tail protein n=1 Tax=Sphingomonas oleivorans TaxID=1735121 RepID=A0A2T5G3C0_9SPHN|nr:hypothetical protein [Sphingomonas oleivorans]PTQ13731.1 hypothetical protein CLG96_00145 [Sphingomonas oleivorans]
MSEPTTFEFAVIKVKTGPGSTDADYTTICGIQTTGFNRTKQTNDHFVRDCASPARTPERRVRVTGTQRDLTGSGLYNVDQTELINSLEEGRHIFRYIIMDISDPAVAAGTVIGTWEGPGVVTAINLGTTENDDASIELTIASDGAWTYVAAA